MDVELILSELEHMNLIRTSRKIGDYMQIYCPFHNDGNEKKPSCGVLLHDIVRGGVSYKAGWFHCFTCSYSADIVKAVNDILKVNDITQSGFDWLRDNIPGFADESEFQTLLPSDMIMTLENKLALEDIKKRTSNSTHEYVTEEELAKYRYTVPYMYERKLTDDIIAKYDIGVDMNWIPPGRVKPVPAITFPVNDEQGNTLFICRRSISGKLYNYPNNITKTVFGIDKLSDNCKSVIVCESCFNALTAVSYGYDAVALLGTGNSYQINQLKRLGIRDIVLCMDGDDAGRRAAIKLKKQLVKVANVWIIDMPEGKDLNDCTKEEFDRLYETRE